MSKEMILRPYQVIKMLKDGNIFYLSATMVYIA